MGEEKKAYFLKVIIIQKFTVGLIELAMALGVLALLDKDMGALAEQIARFCNLDTENHYVSYMIEKAGFIGNHTIMGASGVLFLLSVLAFVEGYGLYIRRRWAEWLTVASTSLFIPLELYEVIREITLVKVGILVFNCAVVYYLAKHKELFSSVKNHSS